MKSRRNRTIHIVSALALMLCTLAQGATYYVSPQGDGTTGQTWVTALHDIQTALDMASSSGNDTIKVMQGTYPITTPIRVTKPVTLNGGYTGDGDARNAAAFITTVQGGGDAIHCFQISANATIDGFWIVNGCAFGSGSEGQGGGMYINQCSPTIYNCTFKDNYAQLAGGAIYARFAGGSISDCSFVQNRCGDDGGAIYLSSSSLTISECIFTANRGDKRLTCRGGAIFNEASSPTISDCLFSGNAAGFGAGVYNDNSHPVIVGCTFGGCDLGTGRGGGIYGYQSSATVSKCLFYGNHVDISGGAMYEGESCSASVRNCIFRNNAAVVKGGAIYTDTGSATVLTNCTIYANSAGNQGGAIYNCFGKPVLTNSIVWDNTASMGGPGIANESSSAGAMVVATYSDIQGTDTYPGTGNIKADPQFVYPANDDLRLTSGSPCLDVGNNSVSTLEYEDFEGKPRVVDGDLNGTSTVDMGAYEHQRGMRVCDHLNWVYISQGQFYASPTATSPGFMFLLEVQTDNSVDRVEFLTPGAYVYRIPNTPATSSGDTYTTHTTSGAVHTWRYWCQSTDASSALRYGDGGYLIILYYKNGSSQQTNVSFTLPGSYGSPVPAPTQRPTIVKPAHQARVASPVTVEWEPCTDSAITSIFVAVVDPATGAQVAGGEVGTTAANSQPLGLEEGIYHVELAFESSYHVTNVDGVNFLYSKSVISRSEFEVLYADVYRFFSPVTGRHFYTINGAERDWLRANHSYHWTYEGPVYRACTTSYHPGMSPVYRFWSGTSGSHFYTISQEERDWLIANYSYYWTPEGVAFYAFTPGTQPAGTKAVYRFWSPVTGAHFYTMNEAEKNWIMIEWPHVFTYEGIGFYAFE